MTDAHWKGQAHERLYFANQTDAIVIDSNQIKTNE